MPDQTTLTQPMRLPMRTPKQFRQQYKNVDVVLRGPVPLEAYLEWCKYAKSVRIVTPKVE